ncbi:hypothetical protein [Pantoea sp. SM3]|uniref:hypothetical protein n=1 Tax=Pantoea sp. SM3 TaxID=1628192 RepID=UPI0005F809C1|nr:hypothetical protein [Pantoea sp. SM3]KJV35036.1 hypothetical protein VI01_02885 [Pantoea sp. SM3]
MKRLINELNQRCNEDLSDKDLIDMLTHLVNNDEIYEYIKSLLDKSTLNINGYEHQIGFYKFVISEIGGKCPRRVRLHFWKYGEVQEDVHDHIASFSSRVLHGTILSKNFILNDDGERYFHKNFAAVGHNCKPYVQNLEATNLSQAGEFQINSNEVYYVNFDDLHCIEPLSEYAITLVLQNSPNERNINVYSRQSHTGDSSRTAKNLDSATMSRVLEKICFLLGKEKC